MSNELTDKIEIPIIYDHHYEGGIDKNGIIKQVWDSEALNNSIKMWLASFSGEIIRNPSKGGYVMSWLLKPMSQVNKENLEMAIRDGFYQDFTPYLEILNLNVEPNYEYRYWHIQLEAYSPNLKLRVNVSEKIKNRV